MKKSSAVPWLLRAALEGDARDVLALLLVSRGHCQVQGRAPAPDTDLTGQRVIVDAFLAAARGGDFEALVSVLDPDVVARSDGGALGSLVRHGARTVAGQAIAFARFAQYAHPALVNGTVGVVATSEGRALSVMSFTIAHEKVTAIDTLNDPERLRRLDLSSLDS
ncbi:hypothetical protein J7E96_06570 [Streptomyces sp. ISL-96]|uniref:hypothetical protein n=1 Tax=Streptomyces sp. ISL-96 TaxID=2819191 RepID=UPI001BE4EF38|nr:hypothetical protein [Streptomyces sp. ISL-96]MBT2488192.1 hypothetical protein [Streptomyces sp. ISL-96]